MNDQPLQNSLKLNACLLVGGRSSRMGRPKHLIQGDNGLTWIENSVALLTPFVDEIVLSGAGDIPSSLNGLRRLPDVDGVEGPLTGILAAMRWEPAACWLLIACDMPNITVAAVKWLLATRDAKSWGTVPRLHDDGFVEPLLALYEPQAKQYFEELCNSGILRISMVARQSKIATPVVPKELARSWCNINTPDELSSNG